MKKPESSDYDRAVDFLLACWRGIDLAYKKKYKTSIWDQFESRIRASSYTSSLVKMFEHLKKHLPLAIREADLPVVESFLKSEEGDMYLDMFRKETAFLVVLVRNKLAEEAKGKEDVRRLPIFG